MFISVLVAGNRLSPAKQLGRADAFFAEKYQQRDLAELVTIDLDK
jgi:hypothetical protein